MPAHKSALLDTLLPEGDPMIDAIDAVLDDGPETEPFEPTRLSAGHQADRPKVLSDLAEGERYGEWVFNVNTETLPAVLFASAGTAMLAAEKAGLVEVNGYRSREFHLRLTQTQVAAKLVTANERYDRQADKFDAAMVTRTQPGDWSDRTAVQSYCEKRGLALPWSE
jgi:hypothetical protein